jgi:type II secretory pathway pseudopilin PulG
LVVIAIIALIATISVISIGNARHKARNIIRTTDLDNIKRAKETQIDETGNIEIIDIALKDNTVFIEYQIPGRKNPFSPIGTDKSISAPATVSLPTEYY